jgi:hypothetical protein
MEDAALPCGASLWTGNDRAESPRREAMRTQSLWIPGRERLNDPHPE